MAGSKGQGSWRQRQLRARLDARTERAEPTADEFQSASTAWIDQALRQLAAQMVVVLVVVVVVLLVLGGTAGAFSADDPGWGTLVRGAARLDPALVESVVTTMAQVVAGVTVAVVVAPAVSAQGDVRDRVSLANWLTSAALLVKAAASFAAALALCAVLLPGAASPSGETYAPSGWLLLPTALVALVLAGITSTRANDAAAVAAEERTRRRINQRVTALTEAGITSTKGRWRTDWAALPIAAGFSLVGAAATHSSRSAVAGSGLVLAMSAGVFILWLPVDEFRVWLHGRGRHKPARAIEAANVAVPIILTVVAAPIWIWVKAPGNVVGYIGLFSMLFAVSGWMYLLMMLGWPVPGWRARGAAPSARAVLQRRLTNLSKTDQARDAVLPRP